MAGTGHAASTAQALIASLQGDTKPFRITLAAYYKMAQHGLLESGSRYDLLRGVIFEAQPISPQHGYAVNSLGSALGACLSEAVVFTQHPLHIGVIANRSPTSWCSSLRLSATARVTQVLRTCCW